MGRSVCERLWAITPEVTQPHMVGWLFVELVNFMAYLVATKGDLGPGIICACRAMGRVLTETLQKYQ